MRRAFRVKRRIVRKRTDADVASKCTVEKEWEDELDYVSVTMLDETLPITRQSVGDEAPVDFSTYVSTELPPATLADPSTRSVTMIGVPCGQERKACPEVIVDAYPYFQMSFEGSDRAGYVIATLIIGYMHICPRFSRILHKFGVMTNNQILRDSLQSHSGGEYDRQPTQYSE